MKRFALGCAAAGIVLCLYGCDFVVPFTTTSSDTVISKRGGKPGSGGGGGTVTDYNVTFGDGVHDGITSTTQPVQIGNDSKKRLDVSAEAFKVVLNFTTTAAQDVEEVGARSRDEILADGLCAYRCPDGYTCDGTLGRLQGALTNTVATDSHSVHVIVDKSAALDNDPSSYNFIALRDETSGGDAALDHPHLNVGRNETPQNLMRSQFLGAAPREINDKSIKREFVFSDGTVELWERQGVNDIASLICNNLDEIYYAVEP